MKKLMVFGVLCCLLISEARDLTQKSENQQRSLRKRHIRNSYCSTRYDRDRGIEDRLEILDNRIRNVEILQNRNNIILNEINDNCKSLLRQPPCLLDEENDEKTIKNTSIDNRIFVDPNQIWGSNPVEVSYDSEYDDGIRPPNLNRIPMEKRRTTTTTTQKPVMKPTTCHAAILFCCENGDEARERCFSRFRCSGSYGTGLACEPETINRIIKLYHDYYTI
ncbi:unnamed protein product [Leptidea sinapis]|uniref:Uncharacterized protein n=1 Tax=Leptidea sinapis TaxID=189913 RepID=A0A5E4PQ97_9NEOP|nr:unnamed protein product [Leptidea sinapis]